MFNLNDIMGSITDYMSGGVADSDIANKITENFPGVDQITEPLTNLKENLPEVPGIDTLTNGK